MTGQLRMHVKVHNARRRSADLRFKDLSQTPAEAARPQKRGPAYRVACLFTCQLSQVPIYTA